MKKQKRSERINLLIDQKTKEEIITLAAIRKTTVNNLINEVLIAFTSSNRDTLNKYNAFLDGLNINTNIDIKPVNSDLFSEN